MDPADLNSPRREVFVRTLGLNVALPFRWQVNVLCASTGWAIQLYLPQERDPSQEGGEHPLAVCRRCMRSEASRQQGQRNHQRKEVIIGVDDVLGANLEYLSCQRSQRELSTRWAKSRHPQKQKWKAPAGQRTYCMFDFNQPLGL